MNRVQAIAFEHLGMCLVLFCCISSPNIVFAAEKHYPVEGTVTALGTNQETTGGSNTPVTNMTHRTYTVKTSTRIFVLECPYWMNGFHIHSPSECGGGKKIELGDTIHFRVQKRDAYVQTANGKEQKLAVLSEGINEAGSPEAVKQP